MISLQAYIAKLFEDKIALLERAVRKQDATYEALVAVEGRGNRRTRSRLAARTLAKRRLQEVEILLLEYRKSTRKP